MEKSESIKNLLYAIGLVQEALPVIGKDGTNPHFKSKFTTLDHLWEKVRPELIKNDLKWITLPTIEGLWYRLEWWEEGKDVEYIEATAPLTLDPNPQKVGSSISYMRRYSLITVLNLMTGEDDDGEKATLPTVSYDNVMNRTLEDVVKLANKQGVDNFKEIFEESKKKPLSEATQTELNKFYDYLNK